MSLNGLDAANIEEAFQSVTKASNGWLVLRYISRDEIQLLQAGDGGLSRMKAAIEDDGLDTPKFAYLVYREKKLVCKLVPDGISRLIQARATVHFNHVTERFSPFDVTITASSLDDLSHKYLASACSLPFEEEEEAGSSSAFDALDPVTQSELQLEHEYYEETQTSPSDFRSPTTHKAGTSEPSSTPTSRSTFDRSLHSTKNSFDSHNRPHRPSQGEDEDETPEVSISNPEVASILAKIRAEKLARTESPSGDSVISDWKSITSDERPRVSRILARLKAEKDERARTPEFETDVTEHPQEDEDEEALSSQSKPSQQTLTGLPEDIRAGSSVNLAGEAARSFRSQPQSPTIPSSSILTSVGQLPGEDPDTSGSQKRQKPRLERLKTHSSEKLWTPEQLAQNIANFDPNVGPRPLDAEDVKRPKTSEGRRIRLPKGLRSLARKATDVPQKKSGRINSPNVPDILSRVRTSPDRSPSAGPHYSHGQTNYPESKLPLDLRPKTATSVMHDPVRSLSLDKPMPPLPPEAGQSSPLSLDNQRLMKALQMRKNKQQPFRSQTESPVNNSPPRDREEETPKLFSSLEATRSDSGVDVGRGPKPHNKPSLHMALHGNPVSPTFAGEAPTTPGRLEPKASEEVFYDASPSAGAGPIFEWNPSALDAIRSQIHKASSGSEDRPHAITPKLSDPPTHKIKRKQIGAPTPPRSSSKDDSETTTRVAVEALKGSGLNTGLGLHPATPGQDTASSTSMSGDFLSKNRISTLGSPFEHFIDPNEASFFLKDDLEEEEEERIAEPIKEKTLPKVKPSVERIDTSQSTLNSPKPTAAVQTASEQAVRKSQRMSRHKSTKSTKSSKSWKRASHKTTISITPSLFVDGDSDSDNSFYDELQGAIMQEAHRIELTPTPTTAIQNGSSPATPSRPAKSTASPLLGIERANVTNASKANDPRSTPERPRKSSDTSQTNELPKSATPKQTTPKPGPSSSKSPQHSSATSQAVAQHKRQKSNELTQVDEDSDPDLGVDASVLDKFPSPRGKKVPAFVKKPHNNHNASRRIHELAELSLHQESGSYKRLGGSALADEEMSEVSTIKDWDSRISRSNSRRPSLADNRYPSSSASVHGSKQPPKSSHSTASFVPFPVDGFGGPMKQNSVSYTARIRRPNQNGIHEIEENVAYSPISPLDLQETSVTVERRLAELPRPSITSRMEDRPHSSKSSRPPSRDSAVSAFAKQSMDRGRRMWGRPSNGSLSQSHIALPSATEDTWSPHSYGHSISSTALESVDESQVTPEQKKPTRAGRFMKRMSALNAVAKNPLAGFSGRFAGVSESEEETQLSPRKAKNTPTSVAVGDLNVQFPDSLLWKRRWVEIDNIGNIALSAPNSQLYDKNMTSKKLYPLRMLAEPRIPSSERQELPFSIHVDLLEGGTLQLACEDSIGQNQVLRRLVDVHRQWMENAF